MWKSISCALLVAAVIQVAVAHPQWQSSPQLRIQDIAEGRSNEACKTDVTDLGHNSLEWIKANIDILKQVILSLQDLAKCVTADNHLQCVGTVGKGLAGHVYTFGYGNVGYLRLIILNVLHLIWHCVIGKP